MKIKKYFSKTREFVRDLFLSKKSRLDKNLLKYELAINNLYNKVVYDFEVLYSNFFREPLQFTPIPLLRTNYDDLFSKDISNEFNIYTNKNNNLILKRKGIEDIFG